MKYEFLVDSYETERVKVLSVWSEFRDEDLPVRPRSQRSARTQHPRTHGASMHERRRLVPHGCSTSMYVPHLLPEEECRLDFMKRYAEDSASRLAILQRDG